MAIDDRGGGLVNLPYAYGTNYADQPGSSSVTARVRGDVDGGNTLELGGLMALRKYDDDRGENDVYGPDFTWQPTPVWKLRGQWLHSQTSAQPDAEGGLSKGATLQGDEAVLKGIRQTDRSQIDFDFYDTSPQFRHDTGFVNQVGVRELDMHQGLVFRQLGKINELWLNVYESQVRDRTNQDVVQEYVTPGFWLSGPDNLQWSLQYRGLSKVRTMLDGPLLAEHYWRTEFDISGGRYVPNISLQANLGRMADYTASAVRPGGQINLDVQTRPLSSLEVEPSVWFAWLKNGSAMAYRESASQLLGVWHIDARQNLRLIVQRYTYDHKPEPGLLDYDVRESKLVTSLTYAWRKSMGTVLYVGWTNGHVLDCPPAIDTSAPGLCARGMGNDEGVGSLVRNSEAFVKLQFDIDEVRRMF
jgi:hypothetical protein